MPASDDPMSQALEIYFARARQLNRKIEAREPVSSDMARDITLALALVLRSYCLPNNWLGEYGSVPRTPLPPQLAGDIARHIEILCAGHIPQWMSHLQKRGAPPADPRIREWQGYAAAYVKVCKQGLIYDKKHVAYAAKLYGVDRKTIQNWVNTLNAEPELFFPQAANYTESAAMIAARIVDCGAKYQTWGRGPNNARPFGKGRKKRTAKRARI